MDSMESDFVSIRLKQPIRPTTTTAEPTAVGQTAQATKSPTTHYCSSPNKSKVDPQEHQSNSKQQTIKNNKQCSSDTLPYVNESHPLLSNSEV